MEAPVSSRARPIRFLFVMFQGGGNIPPVLAVAQQLVAHGHQVCILAGPGLQPGRPPRPPSAVFLESVRTIGATLVPFHQAQDPFSRLPPAQGLLWGWTPRAFTVNVSLTRWFLAAPVWADNVQGALRRQPMFGDQPEVAARVVHAGAGVRLARDAPATRIRMAIQRVLREPSGSPP
jgi:hypothetical protein